MTGVILGLEQSLAVPGCARGLVPSGSTWYASSYLNVRIKNHGSHRQKFGYHDGSQVHLVG